MTIQANPNLYRPTSKDCASYWLGYADKVQDDNVLAALEAGAAEVEATFGAMDEDRALYRYAPGKWSIKELFGHLLDMERLFATRAMAISRGETQSLFGADENQYVVGGEFDGRSMANLLAEYRGLRASNLALYASFSGTQARRRGTANGAELGVIIFPWLTAGHEAHHLGVLAERYGAPA